MDREISPPNTKEKEKLPGRKPNNGQGNDKFRTFSWNVNGISPFLQLSIRDFFGDKSSSSARASLRTFLHRHGFPELLFLQEVKINRADSETQRAVAKAVNVRLRNDDSGPDYQVHFTLPKDKFNAKGFGGKVYGVCTIIKEDFYSKHVLTVRDVSWDLEGRVSVVELNNKLAIWNIYAVNGTDNPYKDADTGEITGTRHDRKLAFHRLLVEECKAMEADGWSHIIAGDMNVAPSRIDGHPNLRTSPPQHVVNRADFNKRFLDPSNEGGLRAVDVWRRMKGNERQYTYYSRERPWGSSCDRVDLILASAHLCDSGRIVNAEIWNTPQERGPSDHVPLSIDVRFDDGDVTTLGSQSFTRKRGFAGETESLESDQKRKCNNGRKG